MEMMRLSKCWFLALLLLAISFVSCNKGGLFDFADGIIVNVNNSILKSPLSISFANGNPSSTAIPQYIQVDVLGEGAERIYSLPGQQDFLVVDGLINIGIQNDGQADPSPADPVRFIVKAQAPGFLPSSYEFSVSDPEDPRHVTIFLLPEHDLPQGVSQLTNSLDLPANGLPEAVSWESPISQMKQEQVLVRIPENTSFSLTDGSTGSGPADVRLIHYDNRSPFSLTSLEGLLDQVNVTDEEGHSLGNVSMFPAFVYELSLQTSGRKVAGFSQAAQVEVNLNPDTYHPSEGRTIKAGDLIPLWRWNEATQGWVRMGETEIQLIDGSLSVVFEQTQTSMWMGAFSLTTCVEEHTVQIYTRIDEANADRPYFVELVEVASEKPIAPKWSSHYHSLENETQLSLRDLPEDVLVKLRVWEGVRHCKGSLLAESGPLEVCTDGQQVDMRAELNGDVWSNTKFLIQGFCGDQEVAPGGTLLYRPAGCGNYGYLGTIDAGSVHTAVLKRSETYDFKVRLGEFVFTFENVAVSSSMLEFSGLELPEDYCAVIE